MQIVLADRGKRVEINPYTVNLAVEEQLPIPKRAKLRETMMEGTIRLSYPKGTSFYLIAESFAEMLY